MAGEAKFWKILKMKSSLDILERVENKLNPGFPDVHFLNRGVAGWLELKAEDKHPGKIKFRPAQPIWLSNYWNAGGKCFVVLFVNSEKTVKVWEGGAAPDLNENGGAKKIKPILTFDAGEEAGWTSFNRLLSFQ